jgi:hypothetical protein
MQTLDRFRRRIEDDWLVTYCSAPDRQYDPAGFQPASIKVDPIDAEDCMQALDSGVVFSVGPGKFRAAKSSAIEVLFWEGRKSVSPRKITLWLEPVITFGALWRLYHEYNWPKGHLGTQSPGWGFDVVAFQSEFDDGPYLLGEVKKTSAELEALRCDLLALSAGADPATIRMNSVRKWDELKNGYARVLWLVGPERLHHVFTVVRVGGTVRIEVADTSELRYGAA